jgi:hypothetical protein
MDVIKERKLSALPDSENIDIDLLSDIVDESIICISERTGYSVTGIIPNVVNHLIRMSNFSQNDSGFGESRPDHAIKSNELSSKTVGSTAVLVVSQMCNDEFAAVKIKELENDNETKNRKIQELEDEIRNVAMKFEQKSRDLQEINERNLLRNAEVVFSFSEVFIFRSSDRFEFTTATGLD